MTSGKDKRKESLNALAGYGAVIFIPPFTEIAYRAFLTHTHETDIGNTVSMINELEILRRRSKTFNDDLRLFLKDFPTTNLITTMRSLIMLKRALDIDDQNYEYRASTSAFVKDIEKFREKVTAQESILRKKDSEARAEGEFRSFSVDIMEYDYERQKAQKEEKGLKRPSNLSLQEQAAAFFSVPRSQAETDAFLDRINREAPARIYSIDREGSGIGEYNLLKGKGLYLQNFPLDDSGMQAILTEAGVIGKSNYKKDSGIRHEANERYGIRKENENGIAAYYLLTYAVPVIKSVDLDNNRVTLIFARQAPAASESSHVGIEMPLSRLVDMMQARQAANAKQVAEMKRHPEKKEVDGVPLKLAFAIRSAQIHAKGVLQRALTRSP